MEIVLLENDPVTIPVYRTKCLAHLPVPFGGVWVLHAMSTGYVLFTGGTSIGLCVIYVWCIEDSPCSYNRRYINKRIGCLTVYGVGVCLCGCLSTLNLWTQCLYTGYNI